MDYMHVIIKRLTIIITKVKLYYNSIQTGYNASSNTKIFTKANSEAKVTIYIASLQVYNLISKINTIK